MVAVFTTSAGAGPTCKETEKQGKKRRGKDREGMDHCTVTALLLRWTLCRCG